MSKSLKRRLSWFLFASSANWAYVSAYLFWRGQPLGAASDLVCTLSALVVVIAGGRAFVQFAEEDAAHERGQRQAAAQALACGSGADAASTLPVGNHGEINGKGRSA